MRSARVPGTLAVALFVGAACAPWGDNQNTLGLDDTGTVFLVQESQSTDVMEALYVGRVTKDETGCLRLEGPDRHAVFWPYGFSLDEKGDELRVKDAGGAHVGVIGETFRLGGGEVATLHDGLGLSEATIKRANELCPGRFWFVGEIPTG